MISEKRVTFCYAAQEGKFIYHGANKQTFSFDFIEKPNNNEVKTNTVQEWIYFFHGIGLTITWSLLIDLSLVIQ